jgi:hypothetical protein
MKLILSIFSIALFISCSQNQEIHSIDGTWQSVSSSEHQFLTTINDDEINFQTINTNTGAITGSNIHKMELKKVPNGYELTTGKYIIAIKRENEKLYMQNIKPRGTGWIEYKKHL